MFSQKFDRGGWRHGHGSEDGRHDSGKQEPEPLEDQAVVVPGADEDSVDFVAVTRFEEVAVQPAVRLHVTDHGLDCRAPSQLLLDGRRDAALLA